MKKVGLLFWFLLAVVYYYGQEKITIQLSVQDTEGKPINNAYVLEAVKNEFLGATTNGKLIFETEELPLSISISHISYQSKVIQVKSDSKDSGVIKKRIQLNRKVFELSEVEISAQQNNLAYQRKQDNVEDYEFYGNDILLLLQAGKKNKLKLINDKSQSLFDLNIPDRAIELIRDCFDNLHVLYKDSIFQVRFTDQEVYLMRPFSIKEYERTLKRCEASLGKSFVLSNYSINGFETDLYLKPPDVDTFLFLQKNVDWVAKQQENYFERQYNGMGNVSSASSNNQDEISRLRALDYAYTYFKHVESKPIYNPVFTIQNQYVLFNHHEGNIYSFNNEGEVLQKVPMKYVHSKEWKDLLLLDYSNRTIYGLFKRQSKRYLKKLNYLEGEVETDAYHLTHSLSTNLQIRDGYLYYLYRKVNQSNGTQQLYKFKL